MELHELLLEILTSLGIRSIDGDGHLYFQPPPGVLIKYPAIVYTRNQIRNQHADNLVYLQYDEYQLTVIDKNPDSELVRKVSQIPKCQHNRHFTADNLNHDVFTLTC